MKKKKSRSKAGEGGATSSSSQNMPEDNPVELENSLIQSLSSTQEGLTSDIDESWIVRAAIENGGDRFVPSRGTLDRGTLAQCLNATSQIAAECNSILRDLLRGRYGTGKILTAQYAVYSLARIRNVAARQLSSPWVFLLRVSYV